MHSPQESIPYLGLSLVTLALSLWLLYFEPEDTSAPFELKGPPDHYIKGLSHTAYSADGARTYAIQAASLDLHQQGAMLKEIAVDSYVEAQPPWQLQANQALWNKTDGLLSMEQAVTIQRAAFDKMPDLNLETDIATYDFEKDLLKSDKEVTLFGDGYRISASELIAHPKQGKLTLGKNVRGMHDLPQ